MPLPSPATGFLEIVRDGMESARKLLSFLEQENTALRNNDLDGFLDLAQRKKAEIAVLEGIEQRRAALLHSIGLAGDERGMADFLIRHDNEHTDMRGHWQKFLGLLKACQRLNDTNGRMIHARQQQLQQALEILRGQLGSGELAYDQQGKTTKDITPTPLAKA